MTITTRSKRVSMFGAAPTPASVGPGAYAPEKHASSFKREQRPLYSGFASSDERNLNANKTTSAITPGPGAYVAGAHDNSTNAALSNVFATKISRFAPSAPGSTIFRASSVQDNPGPGAYMPQSTSNQQEDNRPPVRGAAAVPLVPVKPSVPTIPRKEQSYGYEKDPLNGDLRLQAQPSHIYSGLGQDTVGPAAYSTHADKIWNERKNVAPSIKSTVKREVWEEYATPRRAVPGPGQYDPVGTHRIRGGRKLGGSADRPSAVFASRVPLLPDPKRPDQYDPERELELIAKEQRAQRRHPTTHAQGGAGSKVEAFGSTTGRTDLASQLSAPFSSPTFKATPGPGKYTEHGPSSFSAFQSGSLRRSTHRGRGTVYREEQHIGFTSATERNCLIKVKPSTSPGPGAYKSETPRTVGKDVKARQTVGRFGVFGSTAERRVWENLEAMEPDEITPGPGAYERPVDTHGGHFPLHVNSAAFKSASARFAKRANPHASPHVHCVGDTTAPAVGQYNLRLPVGPGEADGAGTNPGGSPGASPLHSARAPFLSTAERSVFEPKEAKHIPGPGQYESVPGLDGRDLHATLGNEERFRVRPRVPAHVGPGAYAIPGTVGTKSFNVTMAPKGSAPTAHKR